ncbi:MAG: LCP family protein, partial [Nocardioidaceae bacterium]
LARHKVLFALLGLGGLLFAAVGGWAAYLNHQISAIPRIDLDLGSDVLVGAGLGTGTGHVERPPRPTGKAAKSVNILVAGVDAGESSRILDGLEDGAWVPGSHRSDVIMVLHLSADRRKAYVISVPRDTWVPIDGYGMAKINAAFSYGGPPLYVHTLEQFTGLRMDHLAIIDWAGFKDLTDALGGVEIEGATGPTRLDGEQALDYVRERYSLPRGDLDRIQRQQNVLRAITVQLMSAGTLSNPVKLTDVLKAVTHSIVVDRNLTNERMRELALSLRGLRGGDLTQITVPVAGLDRVDGQSIVRVDPDKARELFGAAITDELDKYVATRDVDTLPAPASVR